ncbi:hypothetical protein [Phenylobacterium immobile]|uniref:hypothetical protein n=1 Tax=Phenylobacterium immobile TaxID=21 RepID=UPI000AEBD4F4|nr:hypothetical protein [Phenylobacterium immobile]
MKQLTNFAIEIRANDYVLRLTDEDGQVAEFAASADQVDLVIEAFNDLIEEMDDDA